MRRLLAPLAIVVTAVCLPAELRSQEIASGDEPTAVSVTYEYEEFNRELEPWHLVETQLRQRFGFGSVIGRVNFAERFGQRATQFEVDAYPRFRKGTYAYLNVGKATDSFFPEWRFGAEIFQNLPRSYEISAGARRLQFENTDVNIFTGSLGKYYRNEWFSLRPYVSDGDDGTSASVSLQWRHYFATRDDYFSIVATGGRSPEENVVLQEIDRLQSSAIRLGLQRRVGPRWVVSGRVGYRDVEYREDVSRGSFFVGAGLERRF